MPKATEFVLNISSSKNVRFCFDERFSIADLGYDQDEWDDMTDREREDIVEEHVTQHVLPKYVQYYWEDVE